MILLSIAKLVRCIEKRVRIPLVFEKIGKKFLGLDEIMHCQYV
jgi:hypothetical protein